MNNIQQQEWQNTDFGYPIRWIETNPGGSALVILLHGFGAQSATWGRVQEELGQSYHVISYDRPGFGFTPVVDRTEASIDPYSLEGQVSLLKKIVDAKAAGRPVILLGHSAGGLLATEFSLQHPELIKMLVLESPAIWRGSPVPSWLSRILRSPKIEGFGAKRLLGFEATGTKILKDSYLDQSKLTQEVIAEYKAPLAVPGWNLNLWRFVTSSQKNQVRQNLWRLALPVMVITGDTDRIVKVEDTFKATERIAGHSIYVVPNAGHVAHEEQPDDFLRVVKNFIVKHL